VIITTAPVARTGMRVAQPQSHRIRHDQVMRRRAGPHAVRGVRAVLGTERDELRSDPMAARDVGLSSTRIVIVPACAVRSVGRDATIYRLASGEPSTKSADGHAGIGAT